MMERNCLAAEQSCLVVEQNCLELEQNCLESEQSCLVAVQSCLVEAADIADSVQLAASPVLMADIVADPVLRLVANLLVLMADRLVAQKKSAAN